MIRKSAMLFSDDVIYYYSKNGEKQRNSEKFIKKHAFYSDSLAYYPK